MNFSCIMTWTLMDYYPLILIASGNKQYPGNIFSYPIRLMSTTDLLISLCINSSRKRYFRLKSLCDISETIRSKPDISWQQVAERARIFQCENIVFTALMVTSIATGCKLPENWEEYFGIHPFRLKLIKATVNYLSKHTIFLPISFFRNIYPGTSNASVSDLAIYWIYKDTDSKKNVLCCPRSKLIILNSKYKMKHYSGEY